MTLTDWLRSDWLETYESFVGNYYFKVTAYRLASIGLVGNIHGLPYCFKMVFRLTDWLRSDWLETPDD